MPFPTESSIRLPLLKVIDEAGGQIRASDPTLYSRVATFFPEMTEVERRVVVASGGKLRFDNRVQWARNSLRETDDVASPKKGIWAITPKGKERLQHEWPNWSPSYTQTSRLILDTPRTRGKGLAPSTSVPDTNGTTDPTPPRPETANEGSKEVPEPSISLFEQANREVEQTKHLLLDRLRTITPSGFEKLVGELLITLGFKDLQVTGRSGDGGIDGQCRHEFLNLDVPFQAKRWSSSVGYQPLAEFRGGRAARYERALFITTSTFTAAAKELAEEPTRPKLILINGQDLVGLMVEQQFGVTEQPIRTLVINELFLSQFS